MPRRDYKVAQQACFKRRTFVTFVVIFTLILVATFTRIHRSEQLSSSFRSLENKTLRPAALGDDVFNSLASLGWPYKLASRNQTDPPEASKKIFCNGGRIIAPNMVHYVWLGKDLKFRFLHYLSFFSVHKFIKPLAIFVYGEKGPEGEWWERVCQDVPNVYHVIKKTPSTALNGQKFRFTAHAADLTRTEVLYKLGGIYMDADVLVLKSFDPLRIYSTAMGMERSDGLCNGIMIAEPKAPFIRLLLDQYNDYHTEKETWAGKAVEEPHRLSLKHPDIIHVEETSLNRPNWWEIAQIYDKVVDWSKNYALHLWVRKMYEQRRDVAQSFQDVQCLNTTLGEMSRYIYYGSKDLRCSSNKNVTANGTITKITT